MSYFERVVNLAQNIMIIAKLEKLFASDSIEVMKKKFGQDLDFNVSKHGQQCNSKKDFVVVCPMPQPFLKI